MSIDHLFVDDQKAYKTIYAQSVTAATISATGAASFGGGGTVTGGLVFVNTSISGYTGSSLSNYERSEHTGVMSALFSGTPTVTFDALRIGGLVNIQFPTYTGTSTGTAQDLSLVAALPTRFRPARKVYQPIFTVNDSTTQAGMVIFQTTGNIDIYNNSSAATSSFTGASTVCGFQGFDVSYQTPALS
jgi:hypothetical protein